MPKNYFNKVAFQLHRNHTPARVFSCTFAAYFQNSFSEEYVWRAASGPLLENLLSKLLKIYQKSSMVDIL